MTDDEICGETKNDGDPCEYTPKYDDGKCGIHTECTDTDDGGRPSKFTDERARDAVEAAREGLSKAGCERAAGVGDGTLSNWLEQNPTFEDEDGEVREFFRAFRRARRTGESELVRGGLHDDEVDTSMAKFLLASSFDYKKTEQREVTGEGGGPVQVEVSETVVETPHSED
ncbi:hypothetical protein HZS55_15920 [Halosimplex rubrum]|uniref:Uncharacterized protein n=1 Tax=Halosimplex rubrum TaxID=869889 RepID=A0A7D5P5B7_9EURY|nr:hypothetical protein [Halosimplex rubrum]QLH78684.1 hypothetical protein HZS55_15920 [Halosimplex rubrum]